MNDETAKLVALVWSDPSVQSAADQLRAAKTGPPPGQDAAAWHAMQEDALGVIVQSARSGSSMNSRFRPRTCPP